MYEILNTLGLLQKLQALSLVTDIDLAYVVQFTRESLDIQ